MKKVFFILLLLCFLLNCSQNKINNVESISTGIKGQVLVSFSDGFTALNYNGTAGCIVKCSLWSGGGYMTTTEANGMYNLTLPEGSYVFTACYGNNRSNEQESFYLQKGESRHLNFHIDIRNK